MIRKYRLWWFSLCLLGTALLSVMLAATVENWRGAQEWDAAQRYLKAEGESLDRASLKPRPVPDAENFFATPLLAPMLHPEESARGPGRFLKLPVVRKFPDRSLPNWRIAELPDFADLALEMRSDPAFPAVDPGLAAAEQVTAMLDGRFGAEFRELEEALHRPGTQMPSYLDKDIQELSAGGMVELAYVGEFTKVLRARASAYLSMGRPEEALMSWRIAHRLHDGVAEPGWFPFTLKLSFARAHLFGPVWLGCVTKSWSPEQLHELETRLAGMDFKVDALSSCRGELIRQHEQIEFVKSLTPWSPDIPAGWKNRWALCIPPGWYDFNQANLARRTYREVIHPLKMGRFPTFPATRASGFHPHAVYANRSGAANRDLWKHASQVITELHLARTGCAVERYSQAHQGRYPETLAELVPEFLPAVLTDETRAGAPLNYRLLNGGRFYRIYAFGEDGDDDGGVIAVTGSSSWPSWNKREGDLVWTNELRAVPAGPAIKVPGKPSGRVGPVPGRRAT